MLPGPFPVPPATQNAVKFSGVPAALASYHALNAGESTGLIPSEPGLVENALYAAAPPCQFAFRPKVPSRTLVLYDPRTPERNLAQSSLVFHKVLGEEDSLPPDPPPPDPVIYEEIDEQ